VYFPGSAPESNSIRKITRKAIILEDPQVLKTINIISFGMRTCRTLSGVLKTRGLKSFVLRTYAETADNSFVLRTYEKSRWEGVRTCGNANPRS
jgi:hypothetical protein